MHIRKPSLENCGHYCFVNSSKILFFAFSEYIIQILLCSKDKDERCQGVKKIVVIRGEGDE